MSKFSLYLSIPFLFIFNSIVAQNPTDLPNLSPQSPTSYQFTKYGEVSVNESTGTISPSIPLYTFKAGNIAIPITLSYSGNGVKVAQDPTWAGINWNLMPAGVITRQVRDLVDEKTSLANKKYYSYNEMETLFTEVGDYDDSEGGTWYDELYTIADAGIVDSEADIFNYNFLGNSGSFYLDENLDVHLIKYDRELLIEFQYDNGTNKSEIIIKTPEGDTYFFGGTNASESSKSEIVNNPGSNELATAAQNAFYLSKISFIGGGNVQFNYEQVNPNGYQPYKIDVHETVTKYLGSSISGGTSPSSYTHQGPYDINNEIESKIVLTEITSTFNSKKVEFVSNLIGTSTHGHKRQLDEVLIKDGNNSILQKFDLIYQTPDTQDGYDNRFFLTEVDFYDSSLNVVYDYKLEYDDISALPSKWSFARDYNGYFNNETSNLRLLPMDPKFSATIPLANREASETYSKKGSLKKIIYPTKGYTTFDYELPVKDSIVLYDEEYMHVHHNHSAPPYNSNSTVTSYYLYDGVDSNFVFTEETTLAALLTADKTGSLGGDSFIVFTAEKYNTSTSNYDPVDSESYTIHETTDNSYVNFGQINLSLTFPAGSYRFKLELNMHSTVANSSSSIITAVVRPQIPNGIFDPIFYPSLRIKKVNTYEKSSSIPYVTRYYYNEKENISEEQLHLVNDPNFITETFSRRFLSNGNGLPLYTFDHYIHLNANALNNVFGDDSNKILYPYVTTSFGGDDFERGGKESHFRVYGDQSIIPYFTMTDVNFSFASYGDNLSYANSTLLREDFFSYPNNAFKTMKETIYDYWSLTNTNMNNIKVIKLVSNQLGVPDIRDHNFGFYQTHSYKYILKSITNKEYLTDNPLEILTSIKTFEYDDYVGLPSSIKSTDSKGIESEIKNYYPITSLIENDGLSASEETLIEDLATLKHNIASPYLVKQLYDGQVMSKALTTYSDEWYTNQIWPKAVRSSKLNNGSLTPFEERISFIDYNFYGRLEEVSKTDGSLIKYAYNGNQQVIRKIENYDYNEIIIDELASPGDPCYFQNQHPKAQVSVYEYDSVNDNLLSIEDPRCRISSFHYDAFNRLEMVKDHDNNVLSENEYEYGPINHVKNTAYQVATLNGSVSDDDKIESITYIDELGRPFQSIAKQAGGNKQDIIMPFVYDIYGRQTIDYLPFADKDQIPGHGSLTLRNHTQLLIDLEDYYTNKFVEDQITSTTINAYSENHIEASPLNRVLELGAPGKDWLVDKNSDSDHTIKFDYQTNYMDRVEQFSVIFPTLNTEEPQLFFEGEYADYELYKTITKDENWYPNQLYPKLYTTEEFKDKQGRVILKRTYDGQEIPHDTYYTYDDFGNLSFVSSPKGTDQILGTTKYRKVNKTIDYLDFIPKDKFGNPITTGSGSTIVTVDEIQKKLEVTFSLTFTSAIELETGPIALMDSFLPDMIIGTITSGSANYTLSIQDGFLYIAGSGTLSSVSDYFLIYLPNFAVNHDVLDDLCYQYRYDYRNRLIEKKIPQKGWEYIVYDKLDRPVLIQDAILNSKDEWLFTKYDAFDRAVYTGKHNYIPAGTEDNSARLELQYSVTNQIDLSENKTVSVQTINGTDLYHSNNVIPKSNIDLYSINYYDSHNAQLTAAFSNPGTVFGESTTSDNTALPTGGKVRILGTNDWTTSVSYYDDRGQPLFAGSANEYLNTADEIISELDFTGKLLKTESSHIKGTNNEIVITDNFTYDHTGRMLTQKQQIGTADQELIVKNTYDELGQLAVKGVGNIEASPLQNVDYTYNIRGWLSTINDKEALGNDLFAFGINYNNTEIGLNSRPLYNGNISETIWTTANDVASNTKRGYFYYYDALNRLNTASMAVDTGSNFTLSSGYHVNGLMYDKNGNMATLQRTGETNVFDDLTYTYNGNQLEKVDDAVTNQQTEGFIDGNTSGDDYVYDINGNMIEDKNKGITAISYNHLNLPTTVNFGASNKIEYIYDATGLKLEKQVTDTSVLISTIYAGNFIYEDVTAGESLKFFSHPEGYVEPDGSGGYNYVYQYRDHLGNNRLNYALDQVSSIDIQEDFTSSIYDWSNPGQGGSINYDNQEFNIKLKKKFNSTTKEISCTADKMLHIEFDFENVDMIDPNFYVREKINGIWEADIDRDQIALDQDGHFELDITPAGDEIRLYFEKGAASNDNLMTILVDNIVIEQNILEILEENNYYPFGLKHKGYNEFVSANSNSVAKKFKYQGQELDESLEYNMHEFMLRHYDATLGRFVTTDPYEQFASPYLAMGNNPVVSIDADGGYCTDSNGNTIACPDDPIYNDYRDDDKNGISIPDEDVVINSSSGSDESDPSLLNGDKWELGEFTCETCVKKGQRLDFAMNVRSNGFRRNFNELQLNVFGFYYIDGIRVNSNGLSMQSRGNIVGGSGSIGLIGGRFNPKDLLAIANLFSKAGLTKVGIALQKHGSRTGSKFPRAKGNVAAINAQGEKVLSEILTNPSSVTTTRHHARFGNIIEVKAPNGQGARFTADGEKFIGFIEN